MLMWVYVGIKNTVIVDALSMYLAFGKIAYIAFKLIFLSIKNVTLVYELYSI